MLDGIRIGNAGTLLRSGSAAGINGINYVGTVDLSSQDGAGQVWAGYSGYLGDECRAGADVSWARAGTGSW